MSRIIRATSLACLALLLAGAAPKKEGDKRSVGENASGDAIKLLRVPDGGIQPQALVDDKGTLHLLYFKGIAGAGDIYYVRREAGQELFSHPIRVNSQAGSAVAIGSIRGAQLAIGKNHRVHVAWNGSQKAEPRGAGKHGSPMLYSRLSESDKAFEPLQFEPQRNVITSAYGLDGGGTVAADPLGNVYIAWHANPDGTGEAKRRVYLVHSSDEGRTFAAESPIDVEKKGACGCCAMKAFADSRSTLYLLYCSARQGVNRDMYLLTSNDKGKTFKAVEVSRWQVAACPMSTESFASAGDRVVAAWESNGQVYFARLKPKKESMPIPVAAPGTGNGRKHPALALNAKGETLLVWDKGTGWQKGGSLAWNVFDASAKPTTIRGNSDGIPVWSFPAAVAEPDGTFMIIY